MARVAVVTGGSSGIGAATARALAARGWRCLLVARGEERLRDVADEIGAEWAVCDVSDREAVERLARGYDRVSLLVNNAGIPGRRTFLTADPETIERVLRINYLGGVWCLRAFLPALEAAAPSDVVNVISVAGTVAVAPSGPYSAAKHAQLAFSRATSGELAPRRIRVHTVCPGFVETEGFRQRGVLPRFLERIVIEPDVVADAIVRAVERGRPETFVPAWYRAPAVLQALMPGTIARLVARRVAYRRG